nr:Gfo/Idh/MocA family oxidoreductase [Desulfobacterales bacterium]
MEKVRVGVIGVGYLGRFHAQKYRLMEDVELVGVVDVDEERAIGIASETGSRAFTRYQDIIGMVDAVSIVVPTHLHFEISKTFLENDIDVLIEKPMTTTLDEADTLIHISEQKGPIIQVGHLERFNPAVVALEKVVDQPMFIESHRLSTFKERGTDVDVVLDLMIHDIDIILNFVKSNIKKIDSAGVPVISSSTDIANARLTFENGCVANVTASRISMKNMRKIRIFQKNAYISVDYANQCITIIRKNGIDKIGIIPGMDVERIKFSDVDPLEAELRAFVDSVRTRKVPPVSGRDGRKALKVALGIMDQIKRLAKKQFGGRYSF